MSERAEQLGLVRLDHLPERPDLIELIEKRPVCAEPVKYRHTGRRFLKKLRSNEDLAEFVVLGLRLQLSVRLLAERCGVSPRTIARVREILTDKRELAPVRTRVDRLLDSVVEEGFEYWLDGMRMGIIHPGQIPIAVLAAYDKRSQRDAGVVPGTDRTREEIDASKVLAALAVFRECADAAPARNAPDAEQTGPVVDVDTVQATVADAPEVAARPVDLTPAAPALAGPAPHAADKGGGDRPFAPLQSGRGIGAEILAAKSEQPGGNPPDRLLTPEEAEAEALAQESLTCDRPESESAAPVNLHAP